MGCIGFHEWLMMVHKWFTHCLEWLIMEYHGYIMMVNDASNWGGPQMEVPLKIAGWFFMSGNIPSFGTDDGNGWNWGDPPMTKRTPSKC